MSRKKKNEFLTFIFSLMPGAGEMYLGFMKMGVSLMGLFFAVFVIAVTLNVGVLLAVNAVLWFYSFFHVHNLAGLSDEEFLNTKDEYLFSLDMIFRLEKKNVEKYRSVIAVVLIIVGILLLWNGMKNFLVGYLPDTILYVISRLEHTIPQMLAGIGIIAGGFYMIKGKKEELREVVIDAQAMTVEEEEEDGENDGENKENGAGENC